MKKSYLWQVLRWFWRDVVKKAASRKRSMRRLVKSKTCFSLRNNDATFLVQLSKPRFDETGTGSVILDGLVEQGLMAFVKGWDNNTLGITDEGKQAKIWDAKEGACVGRRVVDGVKEWTEPGNGNHKAVRVEWFLVNVCFP